MRCIIVSGGTIKNLNWLNNYIKKDDFVICADSGAKYLFELNIVPNMIMGDFDSLSNEILEKFREKGSIIKSYSKKKDDTDTVLAFSEALKMNFDEIIITGALGTRFDHSLANVHLLKKALDKGVNAKIINECNEISLISARKKIFLEGSKGETFSLLPLTKKVTGVNVSGAEWPLTDAIFEFGNPYGVSNMILKDIVEISISEGILILIRVVRGGE